MQDESSIKGRANANYYSPNQDQNFLSGMSFENSHLPDVPKVELTSSFLYKVFDFNAGCVIGTTNPHRRTRCSELSHGARCPRKPPAPTDPPPSPRTRATPSAARRSAPNMNRE
jgi:hypothetical protein